MDENWIHPPDGTPVDFWVCARCGATVDRQYQELHDNWHDGLRLQLFTSALM